MQDKETGNMLPLPEEISGRMTNELSNSGFCVLSIGEKVNIRGNDFTVDHFDKHHIMLKCPENFYDLIGRKQPLQIGDPVTVKSGHFKIEHYGAKFLKLRGLPANMVVNQDRIDQVRRKQIETLRKED